LAKRAEPIAYQQDIPSLWENGAWPDSPPKNYEFESLKECHLLEGIGLGFEKGFTREQPGRSVPGRDIVHNHITGNSEYSPDNKQPVVNRRRGHGAVCPRDQWRNAVVPENIFRMIGCLVFSCRSKRRLAISRIDYLLKPRQIQRALISRTPRRFQIESAIRGKEIGNAF